MTPVAILLLLIASVVHAGWNIIGKRQHPSAAFFLLASLASIIALAIPAMAWQGTMLNRIPVGVWLALAITGIFQAAYYASLAGAYRAGKMSIAYPVARSSPLIIVTLACVVLHQGREIGVWCYVGIALVVGGCFVLPMQTWGELRLRNYLNRSCGLALIAACATAGYTLMDNWALHQLRQIDGFTASGASVLYSLLEAIMSSAWLAIYVLMVSRERAQVPPAWRARWNAAAMGLGVCLAYTLVLISLAYVRNVSYAAAFRQVSILVGVAFSAWLLREKLPLPRWVGAATMFTGLVLVALG